MPTFRIPTPLLSCLAAAVLLAAPLTQAADPVRGKTLYNNTPGGTSCANSSCHGTNVALNKNKVLRGANSPSTIQAAINNNDGGMGIYRNGVLSSTDVADIAAYIGNPNATGGTPTASLSPTSLSFASTTVGSTSATQTATLSNTGSAALSITALTAGGSNSADFLRSGSCAAGGSVAAGSSCTLIYSFKPSAAGARSASLSITSNASAVTLSLSGTGASAGGTATASVSPSALSFGTVTVGSTSSTLSTTLSNTGTAALTLNTLSVTTGDFSIAGGSCAAGASLAAGASCTVQTRFQPSVAGARSATLSLATSAGTQSVALSGTGGSTATPTAQLSPGSLSFSTQVGSSSAAQTVTLSNTGSGTLSIASLSYGGSYASEYASASGSTCAVGTNLAANASCVIKIVFTPQSNSARPATLSISHNDAARSPSTVSLNGTGTYLARGQLSLNQVSLSFPAQTQNTSSSAQVVQLSNTGSTSVTFSALSLLGSNAAEFSLQNVSGACTASTVLAQNASCTLNVRFTPAVSSGTRTASLRISSDASNDPVTLSLSGTAAAATPLPVLTPGSLDFGSVGVGSAATAQSLSLRNNGSASLSITSLTASPSDYSLNHNCGASLAAGASCTLQVGFTPSHSGSISGSISLGSNASGSPTTVALSGAGSSSGGALGWDPASGLSFSTTVVGTRSAPLSATLSNTGSGDLVLQQISTSAAQGSEFLIDPSSSCSSGGTLAAGSSCAVVVVFAPAAAGTRSANLSVGGSGGLTALLSLSGSAAATGAPQLSISPEYMTLTGPTDQGLDPQALVLSNDGAGVLRVSGYVVPASLSMETGGSSGGTCPTPPFELQPGYSCSVMVTPTDPSVANGQIQVLSNSSAGTAIAKVSGTANTNVGGGGALLLGRYDSPLHTLLSLALLGLLLTLRLQQRHRHHPAA